MGLGCALLAGCADLFKPADDSEPLHVLNALDSTAIAQMKIAMGVWNGDVRDWIGTYSQSGRVEELYVVASRGQVVDFPDSGLDNIEVISFGVGEDTLIIGGLWRLGLIKELIFRGIDGHKIKAWPRGMYLNRSVEVVNIGGGGLTAIDDSLRMLANLNRLNVYGNDLRSLPEWVYQKSKFSILVFDNHLCNVDSVQANWLNLHATSWKTQRCP